MYFLGIDAGGTSCRAQLIDASGHIVGRGLSGTANLNIGTTAVFSTIMEAAQQAIKEAGLEAKAVSTIRAGMGIAGVERKGARQELLAHSFPFHSTKIKNDAFIANIGAHSGRDGGIAIVGTGSIAVGRLHGKDIRIGGYGFPISDEGSGAYIGLQAIRITLRVSDGRILHSELTNKLFKEFNSQTHEIVSWMDQASASDYAALAPLVVKAAEAGDRHGRLITRASSNHIDVMIRGLFKLGVPRCSLLGGLSGIIEPWLSPDVRAKLSPPDGNALDGAILLAREPIEPF